MRHQNFLISFIEMHSDFGKKPASVDVLSVRADFYCVEVRVEFMGEVFPGDAFQECQIPRTRVTYKTADTPRIRRGFTCNIKMPLVRAQHGKKGAIHAHNAAFVFKQAPSEDH